MMLEPDDDDLPDDPDLLADMAEQYDQVAEIYRRQAFVMGLFGYFLIGSSALLAVLVAIHKFGG